MKFRNDLVGLQDFMETGVDDHPVDELAVARDRVNVQKLLEKLRNGQG